jgi:hypothetical protein
MKDGNDYRLEELRGLARNGYFDESYTIAMSLLLEGYVYIYVCIYIFVHIHTYIHICIQ